MINEITEYTQIECGALPQVVVKFNVAELFDQVMALERPSMAAKKLQMSITIDRQIPS